MHPKNGSSRLKGVFAKEILDPLSSLQSSGNPLVAWFQLQVMQISLADSNRERVLLTSLIHNLLMTLIFCDAKEDQIKNVITILKFYKAILGLGVNFFSKALPLGYQ